MYVAIDLVQITILKSKVQQHYNIQVYTGRYIIPTCTRYLPTVGNCSLLVTPESSGTDILLNLAGGGTLGSSELPPG